MSNYLKWLLIIILVAGVLVGVAYFSLSNIRRVKQSNKPELSKSAQVRILNTVNFKKVTENLPLELTKLELAITSEEHQLGLMNREELCATCGMLFIYNQAESRTFWMKDTNVSLDIIFLDSEFNVINIAQATKINQTTELYSSTKPSQYILEVPAKWSESKNIIKGSIISFKNIVVN